MNRQLRNEIRKSIEKGKIKGLFDLESDKEKDKLKILSSGLTPVIARAAAKKDLKMNLNIIEIRKLPLDKKASYLAKIRQNIRLARKSNLNINTNTTKRKARAILLSLGASTNQASKSTTQSF